MRSTVNVGNVAEALIRTSPCLVVASQCRLPVRVTEAGGCSAWQGRTARRVGGACDWLSGPDRPALAVYGSHACLGGRDT